MLVLQISPKYAPLVRHVSYHYDSSSLPNLGTAEAGT